MNLRCPICGQPLTVQDRQWVCAEHHSFDIARQGYVNLLSVQLKHSRNPGDTREQVRSRREFLQAGFYAPIAQTLMDTAKALGASGPVLDVGCGECYYGVQLAQALGTPLTGLDISKEAVRCAAGTYKQAQWLCATAAHIPVEDGSAGLITSLFALTEAAEFHRVLRPGGYFFQVLARPDHLLGLKGIIYDQVLPKQPHPQEPLPGFEGVCSVPIRFTFTVAGQQVQNLLAMTPHVFRISKAGAERLAKTQTLTDTASCVLHVFRRC